MKLIATGFSSQRHLGSGPSTHFINSTAISDWIPHQRGNAGAWLPTWNTADGFSSIFWQGVEGWGRLERHRWRHRRPPYGTLRRMLSSIITFLYIWISGGEGKRERGYLSEVVLISPVAWGWGYCTHTHRHTDTLTHPYYIYVCVYLYGFVCVWVCVCSDVIWWDWQRCRRPLRLILILPFPPPSLRSPPWAFFFSRWGGGGGGGVAAGLDGGSALALSPLAASARKLLKLL